MANGFGRFFQNLPGQIMGGMPQVPQQPGMGVPSVMGFPAAPGLPAQAPRKGGNWRQNLDLIGSGLREAGGESGQLDAYRGRITAAQKAEAEAKKRQEMFDFAVKLDPVERQVFLADPEAWAKSRAKGYEPSVVANESSVFVDGKFQRAPSVDYTMKPGEVRFGGENNRVVSSAPFAPQIVTSKPGDTTSLVTPGRGAPSVDDLFGALIQQESGGKPGVLGPQTPYGQAQGATQMLPQTAQAMAAKLNVPWRPELMTGTTPEAEQYQTTLGRAYFDEGMQKYGGDPRKALMYYHGGPDESLWGPKTNAYADAVLARAGGPSSQVVGQGQPTGFRPATSEDRQRWSIPEGVPVKINILTGEPEAISGMAGAMPKPPPAQVVSGYGANRAAVKKIDGALAMLASAPQAVGLMRGFGDAVNQRADPGGVEARQVIMDIAGEIMSDRSGAAVPAAEMVRLEPYLPNVTDNADSVRKKLAGLKRELESINSQMEYDFPTLGQPGAGQRATVAPSAPASAPKKSSATAPAPPRKTAAPAASAATTSAVPKVGEVRKGYRFKGGDPANPSSWAKVQ